MKNVGSDFFVLLCLVTLITVGSNETFLNRKTWLTESTPFNKTLAKRTLLQGTHENLTNCKERHSKSDALWNIQFKNWRMFKKMIQNGHVVKFSFEMWPGVFFQNQNLTRCMFFDRKSDVFSFFSQFQIWRCVLISFKSLHGVNFWIQIMIFMKAQSMQNMSFSRVKMDQNVMFLKHFVFKIWQVEDFYNENLSRCKKFWYRSVLGRWVVVWMFWSDTESLSLVCLSDLKAAVSMISKMYGYTKILMECSSSLKQ